MSLVDFWKVCFAPKVQGPIKPTIKCQQLRRDQGGKMNTVLCAAVFSKFLPAQTRSLSLIDYFFDKKKVQFVFTLEKWKKVLFFGEDGIFFAKLAFSAVICGIRLHLHLTSI
jgi:hypothetical protein